MSLNKAVRQGMVKQDRKNRYCLVSPVIQFMQSCLPQNAVCNAVINEVLPIDNNQSKNCLEKPITSLDARPKKYGNKCNCRIGYGCPSSCKKCRMKTKLKVAVHREKASHIRLYNKYCNKMKTGVYAKIVKCPECYRILSMKRT